MLYRAAFDPMHIGNNGVKISFIKASDFPNGTLSVWRVGGAQSLDHDAAVRQIRIPVGQQIHAVYAVTAEQVRKLTVTDVSGQFLCVLDETDTGAGFHPAHAHISPCRSALEILKADPDLELVLRRLLYLAFLQHPVR
ncbi:hypothetical protein [Elioraea rosea]|uniref:hypothetical protein n=1 Tax=Elioraea rosea TaxID=2492390 RepID=UPI001182940F|nr:hypothetical protein [Elioraea rosea]